MSALDDGKVVPFDGVMQEPFWQKDSGYLRPESALSRKLRRGKRVCHLHAILETQQSRWLAFPA